MISRAICSTRPPASVTTVMTFASARSNCAIISSTTICCRSSQPIWPAMKSKRPPGSATTPFACPRGAPSDSGLMKVRLMSAERSRVDCHPDRAHRIVACRELGADRGRFPHRRREIYSPPRSNQRLKSICDANLTTLVRHLQRKGAIGFHQFDTTRRFAESRPVLEPDADQESIHRNSSLPLPLQWKRLRLHDEAQRPLVWLCQKPDRQGWQLR